MPAISAMIRRQSGIRKSIWYKEISENRFKLLYQAYRNSPFAEVPAEKWAAADYDGDRAAFEEFSRENAGWLDDYALYSAVKNSFHGAAFSQWDDDIRRRKPEVMKAYQEKLSDEIRFYKFQQYLFLKQWQALKSYANENGIRIIGDIPIYVAFDSADRDSSGGIRFTSGIITRRPDLPGG